MADTAETPLRILSVDDVPDDTALVVRTLTKGGLPVVWKRVETAEALRGALETFRPDVVLGDFSMPHLGGLEAIAIVRAQHPDLPYVVVTGSLDEETAAACIKAGADEYVLKERLGRLPHAVRAAIEARVHRAARRAAEAALRLRTSALEATTSGVVITDHEGTIVWVNPAFTTLTGYAADEVVGKSPMVPKSGIHPEAFYRQLWETIDAGRPWRGEVFSRRKDGSIYLEEMSVTPVPGADGEPAHFVAITQDITERKRQESELRTLSTHDLRTGLPNQAALREDLEAACDRAREGEAAALVLLDVDRFAVVNDALGHTAGDRLIVLIADRVASVLPDDAVVYRFGGDELAVLLGGTTFERALEVAERIRESIGTLRYGAAGAEFDISASLGAVPVDGTVQATPLLSLADSAVQAAKERGRDRVVALRSEGERPRQLDEAGRWAVVVRDALRHGRLRLHLQRIVRISDEAVDHFEGLVRLVSPADGLTIPPGSFLPAAATFGLMPALDEWVVREGIRLLAADPSLKLHVNVSAQGLGDRRLLDTIVRLVEDARLEPGRLGFEITETAAISDLGALQVWALRLRELGCLFALDDFGTGFSSFAYLRALPVDLVKLDGSFVGSVEDDPATRAIVKAMVAVAHALGKQVVAEMVERESTARALLELGVEYGQGWRWGRPEPARGQEGEGTTA